MKKYFMLLAAAATVLAVSCAKEKNQPKVDPTPNVVEEEDTTPQPIRFGTNVAVVKSPVTKGLGAIDTWNNNQTLYIYGLQRTAKDATTYDWDHIKIDNIGATAPNGVGATGRDEIEVKDPNNNLGTQESPNYGYFYYVEGEYYDFYGYYVDDACGYTTGESPVAIAPDPTKNGTAATITLPVEIDGTQDIMLAENASAAAKTEDIMWRDDQSKAIAVADLYSNKSARRGVVPNLHFEHQLSRFVFNVVKADNNVTAAVEGLTMKSHAEATLTIVGANRGLAFGNSDKVDLAGKCFATNTAPYNTFAFAVKPNENDPIPATAKYADIMVEPGSNEYDFTLKISQPGTTATAENPLATSLKVNLGLEDPNDANSNPILAEAGKKYVVNVVVYGLEQIKITVSLAEWDEVDLGWVDPDKAGEAEDARKLATLTLKANAYANNTPGAVVGDADGATIANGDQAIISIAGATWGDTPTDLTELELTALKASAYFKSSNINVAKVDKSSGVVTVVGTAGQTATITVTVNNENYYGTKTFVITVAAAPALPVPVFAGLPAAAINITHANIVSDDDADRTTAAVYSTCQYNSTDCDTAITITVMNGENPVAEGFTLNANKTITVAKNTAAGTYAVTLHVAAKDGVYQAADATPFNIVIAGE